VQGAPYLFDAAYYSTTPGSTLSILPQIYNTAYVLVATLVLLVPLALGAAIYLVEYARQGLLVTVIHFAAETLAGVPSLVLGLFGFLLFATVLGLGYSRLSGILTLVCLNLPLALRLFEDALTAVSPDQREAALSLGSHKWHTIRTAVLPSALPGIITAMILSAGKVLAESAILIFTAGTSTPRFLFSPNRYWVPFSLGSFQVQLPLWSSPFVPSETLTVHIYEEFINSNGNQAQANGIAALCAALLIIGLLVINIGARSLGRFLQKRLTAA
jgi:phosphate transport system permease protein